MTAAAAQPPARERHPGYTDPHVLAALATAGPLTDEDRDQLAVLLAPSPRTAKGAA